MGKQLKDFSRQQIAKIATQYAKTDYDCDHNFFEKQYHISSGTFYRLLDKAVVASVVSAKTVERMQKKAANNSGFKAGTAAKKRSKNHYAELKAKRQIYLPSKKEMVAFTEAYAESELNKKDFAYVNFIDWHLFDRILYHVISNHMISKETFGKLKAKAFEIYETSPDFIGFWEMMETLYNEAG